MAETYAPPVPVKIRTARKRHACDDCGQPVEPGDRYELAVTPPNRDENAPRDRWLAWRSHWPRGGRKRTHLLGCDEAAAYRERAEREEADAR